MNRGGSFLFLLALVSLLSACGYEETCKDEKTEEPLAGGFDPNVLGNMLGAQIFHANVDDVFPTNPFLSLSPPNFKRTRLQLCPKESVATCVYYGEMPLDDRLNANSRESTGAKVS